jgi:hypothetical protein
MAMMTSEKRYALEWIDEQARRFSDFHLRIWNYAEPAWREYKSAKAYCDLMRAEGFAVEEGSGEMPTAFCARWGKSGPVCHRFAREHVKTGDGGFEMRNVDGDRFATFVLAVLWRASITSRVEFRKVLLGPYEDEAREVIFGMKPLHKMAAYQLLLARYIPPSGNFNPAGNYTSPARLKVEGANAWAFALHGFRIIAKIDRRPLPAGFHLIVANGRTKLNGPFVPYHATTEGRAMAEMKKADLARLARRSTERRS